MACSTRYNSPVTAMAMLVPLLIGCEQELHWLSVEAEVKEVCIVGLSSEFEASSDGIGGVVSRVIGGQELGIRLDERFSAELFLSGVGMSSSNGEEGAVVNFDFIKSLRVEVSGAGVQSAELLNFSGDSAEMGSDWFVRSQSEVDIAQYIAANDLQIKFEFAGALPSTVWTANMEICLTVQASFAEPLPL